jgi:TPR repeat protein
MSEPAKALSPYHDAYAELTRPDGDFETGLALLQLAVEAGDPVAQYALGRLYLDGRAPHVRVNKRKGIALLKSAASANISDAQYDLANCYESGEGVDKDDRLAFEWYLRAALHGNAQSVWEVGRCYYFGIGIAQDRRLSDIMADRAKELGIDDSAD